MKSPTGSTPKTTPRTIPGVSLLSLAVILIGLPLTGNAATMMDWLVFSAGPDRTHFSLVNDSGQAVAQAQIQLISGSLVPLSPSAGTLQSDFWVTPPDFTDSALGDSSVATTKIQVAPQSGLVQYRLTVTGADLTGLFFGIGQLYGVAGSGRSEIAAVTAASAVVPVDFLNSNGWDDGLRSYTEPVAWDAVQQVLTTSPSADGESAVSFFRVPVGGSPVTQLSFYFPNGYNGAVGDAIEFAFGTPVPEPSVSIILLAGLGWLWGRSRTRQRRS